MHREPLEPSAADRRALHRGRAGLRRRARGVSGRSRRRLALAASRPWPTPTVAPTPTADDYYILRQLAARSRNARRAEREQRPAEVLTAPKMYIGASASLQSMQYADSAAAEAAENALRQLAETGAVPAAWAAEALDTG